MKRYFSGSTAQQAPTPCAARHNAVSGPVGPEGTDQTAFTRPQLTKSNSPVTRSQPSARVIAVDHQVPNRLFRTQAQGPYTLAGGASRRSTLADVTVVVLMAS